MPATGNEPSSLSTCGRTRVGCYLNLIFAKTLTAEAALAPLEQRNAPEAVSGRTSRFSSSVSSIIRGERR